MKRNNNTLSLKATSPKLLRRYVRLLLWLNNISYKDPYLDMVERIIKLITLSGRPMAVQYLKGAKLHMDHYLAGSPVFKSGQTPRIAISKSSGLPLIIPSSLRDLIARRDLGCIRVVAGLLSIFRVIPLKGEPKLSTITDPFKGLTETLNEDKLLSIYNDFFLKLRGSNPQGKDFPLPLMTAGPNYKISMFGATMDAYAFTEVLLNPFTTLSRYFGSKLHLTLNNEREYASDLGLNKELKLGKLSAKQEAAGKVRIFAILDVWSQTALQPIHQHIFSILKKIPNDGCFDQEAPLKRLLGKGLMNTYSYDLSAATDRFPIALQEQVLSLIYTKEIASCWKQLLINRDYHFKSQVYQYSVGQPMGALSSWGVFSLSHHFVVQYAARKCGFVDWFDDYALLGDDIVIANKDVAKEYHYIMTELLGVEINLSKSIKSEIGVMEFAKRLVSPTSNFSPVGPKNVTLALKAPAHIPTLVLDYLGKGGSIYGHAREWMRLLTHDIVKVSSGNKEALEWAIIGPFGSQDSGSRFGPSRVENALTMLHYWDSVMNPYSDELRLHDITNSVIDDTIIEDLETAREKMEKRSYEAIRKYMQLREVPGFNSDTLRDSYVFRHFLLRFIEQYFELLEDQDNIIIPKIQGSETMTISDLVQAKLESVKTIYPVSYVLDTDIPKRPRFRKVTLNFFTKVNRLLDERYDRTAVPLHTNEVKLKETVQSGLWLFPDSINNAFKT